MIMKSSLLCNIYIYCTSAATIINIYQSISDITCAIVMKSWEQASIFEDSFCIISISLSTIIA